MAPTLCMRQGARPLYCRVPDGSPRGTQQGGDDGKDGSAGSGDFGRCAGSDAGYAVALASPAYPQTVSEDLAADEDGNLVGPRPIRRPPKAAC